MKKTTQKTKGKEHKEADTIGSDFVAHFWEDSWTYIKTVVDVVREPILILDKDFRVVAANEPFYETFKVKPKDTEQKIVYRLGNGQWDIPALRKLLENILPKHTFFKGFQVAHEFPSIGRKVMILNGRQIYYKSNTGTKAHPSIILLAIEDVTEMMSIADSLAGQANKLHSTISERTQKLESHLIRLQSQINKLKKK